jgi:hypothetical protein
MGRGLVVLLGGVVLLAACGSGGEPGASEASAATAAPTEQGSVSGPTETAPPTEQSASETPLPVEVPSGAEIVLWLDEGLESEVNEAYEIALVCMEGAGFTGALEYVEARPLRVPGWGITAFLGMDYPLTRDGWGLAPGAPAEALEVLVGSPRARVDQEPASGAAESWGDGCLGEGFTEVFGPTDAAFTALNRLVTDAEEAAAASRTVSDAWTTWASCASDRLDQARDATEFPAEWFPDGQPAHSTDLAGAVVGAVTDELFATGLPRDQFLAMTATLKDFESALSRIDGSCRSTGRVDDRESAVLSFELEKAFGAQPEVFMNMGYPR